MVCSAKNSKGLPCGIKTKHKYCHVHVKSVKIQHLETKLDNTYSLIVENSDQKDEIKILQKKIKSLEEEIEQLNTIRKYNQIKNKVMKLTGATNLSEIFYYISNDERLKRIVPSIEWFDELRNKRNMYAHAY